MVHPLDFVAHVLNQQPITRSVRLGVYRRSPGVVDDIVTRPFVRATDLHNRFVAMVKQLGYDEEVVAYSDVGEGVLGPPSRHLPMVDFKTSDGRVAEAVSANLVQQYGQFGGALYATGKSFHLYLSLLLVESDWVKFMGQLLLFNTPQGDQIVDARWVGYRLMRGRGALRLTANTPRHTQVPVLVRKW